MGPRPRPQEKEKMTRESIVQVVGLIVAAVTVLVTVMAVVHLFSV